MNAVVQNWICSQKFAGIKKCELKISREAGALGSRLTGAGWGGCTVSLVPHEKLEDFFREVKHKYYQQVLQLDEGRLEKGDILFATKPGSGAALYQRSSITKNE